VLMLGSRKERGRPSPLFSRGSLGMGNDVVLMGDEAVVE